MTKKHDDGLAWLRKLRLKIAADCGNDLHAVNELYLAAAARVAHRSYQGKSPAKLGKRKILAHG